MVLFDLRRSRLGEVVEGADVFSDMGRREAREVHGKAYGIDQSEGKPTH